MPLPISFSLTTMKKLHQIAVHFFLFAFAFEFSQSETTYTYHWEDLQSSTTSPRTCDQTKPADWSTDQPECNAANVGWKTWGSGTWTAVPDETESDDPSHCPGLGRYARTPDSNTVPPCKIYEASIVTESGTCIKTPCETEEDDYCPTCPTESEGSPQDQCQIIPTVCSVRLRVRIGVNKQGKSIGSLIYHQEKPSRLIYSSTALKFSESDFGGGIVLRNPDYSIRQIIADNRITEIIQTSPTSFTLGIYLRPEKLEQDNDGFVNLTQLKPQRFFTLSRPQGAEGFGSVDFSDKFGDKSRDFQYRFNQEKQGWSYTQVGSDLVQLVYDVADPVTRDVTNVREYRDTAGNLLKTSRRFLKQTDFGRYPIADEVESAGEVQRTTYAYYNNKERDGAYYGRMKSIQNPDGSWKYFRYDVQGREECTIEPWKDTPLTSNPNEAKATWYSARFLNPGEPLYYPGAKVMEVKTTILGVTVAKTYQSATAIAGEGRVEVEENVTALAAGYGDKTNQRTVLYYYPNREADPNSDKPARKMNPDGTVILYSRVEGDYLSLDGQLGVFEARRGAGFIETTTMEVPAGAQDGLVGKTTKEITVSNSHKQDLLRQNFILAAKAADGANEWKPLNWTGYVYDERGRNTLIRDNTGITAEYRYNDCCNKLEWQRDVDGMVTSLSYDPLNRVKARIRTAPGQPQVVTHYRYDPLGNLIETTQVSGELELTTTSKYDGFDRIISQTGTDQLTTIYQYDTAKRRTIQILPTHATQVEDRYADGRPKAFHGTAVVAQHYDYGVEPGTASRWSEVATAKPGGPRWSRTFSDPLDRTIRSESPSIEEGIVLASLQAYDLQGRITAVGQSWSRLPKDGRSDDVPHQTGVIGATTLYQYDPATGERLLSGQDIDGNGRLDVGGKDQLTTTETRHQLIGERWYLVQKTWTYPAELNGKRYQTGERRQLVSNLGGKPTAKTIADPDFADSVLVSEFIHLIPGKDGKMLPNIQQTYRHRETSATFGIQRSAEAFVKITVTRAGKVMSTAELVPGSAQPKLTASFEYDALDRRISTTDPRTGISRTEYDPKTGRVIAEIDPQNRRTQVEYYPAEQKHAGQVSAVLNPAGKTQRFAYNLRGQQVGIWGDTQYPIAYEYNEYGERIGMRTFHLTPDGQPGLKENEGARTTWTFHEATGSLLKKSYADGTGPEYAYDKTGQLAERKWARSQVANGERVSNPPAKPISPKPDDNPRITTSYSHDPVTNLPTKASYSDGTEITYVYDDSQRLTKVTDSTGTREFTYNIKGQILSETVSVKQPGEALPLRYQITRTYYDEFCAQCAGGGTPDQPKQVTLTGLDGTDLNHQVSYEWDIRGQLAKVESPAGTFSYTYDPQNPALLSSLQGPAHKVEYEYEPHRNLITSVKNLNVQNQGVISSYGYENDILGRRTQINQRGSAFDMLQLYGQNTVQVAYNDRSEVTVYDITKLLDGVKQSGGVLPTAGQPRPDALPKPPPQFAQTYAYDSIGNRTHFRTETGGEKTDVLYESNALNQYTKLKRSEQDPENPTHDPDGNLLDDQRNHYTWNAENRMVKVEAKDGSYTVENAYDYQGRKTTRRHSTPTSVKTTTYLYDGWNVIAEIEQEQEREASSLKAAASSLKSAKRTYTWGRDLSGKLQGVGGVGGQLAITKKAQNQEDSVMFPCYDANGNIGQMISPKGEFLAAYQYDGFGRTVDMAGPKAAENEWRFSTKPLDKETGCYNYGLRDYSLETGRWTSLDPIGEQGGVNLYGFVGNTPILNIDKYGLAITEFTHSSSTFPVRPSSTGWDVNQLGRTVPTWAPQISVNKFTLKVDGALGIMAWYNSVALQTPTAIQSTITHERVHVEIFKNWWNKMKTQLDQYDGFTDKCKDCIDLHRTYALAIHKKHQGEAYIENGEFDISEYGKDNNQLSGGIRAIETAGELMAESYLQMIEKGCKTPPGML